MNFLDGGNQDQLNRLALELQDAHLIIGQQQVQMLRQGQALQQCQSRIIALEMQLAEAERDEAEIVVPKT